MNIKRLVKLLEKQRDNAFYLVEYYGRSGRTEEAKEEACRGSTIELVIQAINKPNYFEALCRTFDV